LGTSAIKKVNTQVAAKGAVKVTELSLRVASWTFISSSFASSGIVLAAI